MSENERAVAIDEARESLTRMRLFDPTTLPRTDELGSTLDFRDAVAPAYELINLYKQISEESLQYINIDSAGILKKRANQDFNLFKEVLEFNANQGNPANARDSIVQRISAAYNGCFNELHPIISYATGRQTDFAKLADNARASIQEIQDRADKLKISLEEKAEHADSILSEIRAAAAEKGVSQQAIYFKDAYEDHKDSASKWLNATIGLTVGLAAYAIGTVFLHKWTWLAPDDAYSTIQLAISKTLVFAAIGSFLVLAGKNYMAHKHNAVVNKHRQNALVTYKALVDAGGDETNRDIVLGRAANCIFADQPSGFSKSDASENGQPPVFSLTTGPIGGST